MAGETIRIRRLADNKVFEGPAGTIPEGFERVAATPVTKAPLRVPGLSAASDFVDKWAGSDKALDAGLLTLGGAGWTPTLTRLAAGGAIGAATSPGERAKGAVGGVAKQAIGEAALPAAIGIQRLGTRAFNRLSDEIAGRLMSQVKDLAGQTFARLPTQVGEWFTSLPAGQAGVRKFLGEEGGRFLENARAAAEALVGKGEGLFERWAAHPMGKRALEAYNELNGLRKTLLAAKALDAKTGRLDPEALVLNVSKATKENPETLYDAIVKQAHAPKARAAVKELEDASKTASGQAPTKGSLHLPLLRSRNAEMGITEPLPLLPYSRHIRTTPLEQWYRTHAPAVAGAGAQMLPFPPKTREGD